LTPPVCPAGKSKLGFNLLAMAGTGRCRLYRRDGSADSERMWHEVEKARYELKGEETMKFFVPPAEGHDDYLMSLALCCHAAQAAAPPAESAVIQPKREAYERW
jgi:hypothetical protein